MDLDPAWIHRELVDLDQDWISSKLVDLDQDWIRGKRVDLDQDRIRSSLEKFLRYMYFVDLHRDFCVRNGSILTTTRFVAHLESALDTSTLWISTMS